ncbi:hypothetical protein PgNI_05539 [Pyricularia grisea]|uniref:CAP20 n=1 Tax=Pyricularia grisea TaxID=148305 RepID=A0A6P8B3W6_PYRGI|nr:hypothetical protein PgNI_05539 [Pyricularia grisea]TLD10026.1 hypothetical protein PgNI_05539 [Pyricularia grisea]
MASPQVNGEVPHSAFFDHLAQYPVVNDGIEVFKKNPYGQRSINVTDMVYKRVAKPVIPYLSRPYQYVSPYVKKVDDIGDKTLARVDKTFPAVKKPTADLYADVSNLVTLPLRKTIEGKDHVVTTYSQEYKSFVNNSGNEGGLVIYGKALFGTALILTAESISWVKLYLHKAKEDAKAASANSNNSN